MEELLRTRVSALSAYRSVVLHGEPKKQPPSLACGLSVSPESQKIKKRSTKRQTPRVCPVPAGAINGEQPRDTHPIPAVVDAAAVTLAKRRRAKRRSRLVATSSGPRVALQEDCEWSPVVGKGCLVATAQQAAVHEKEQASARPFQADTSLRHLFRELAAVQHSREKAARLFEWLIAPISLQQFFNQYWEKKPLLIHRHNPSYYQGLFSTAEFDAILHDQDIQFGVNLDVTSYKDGRRETHNPLGRALPALVWDFYRNGCSLRMLNPQAFSPTIWRFLSLLQEQFGSMVGANTYLTPAGTQGFAPHYDDIEAFIVQLEGKKHWCVYKPRSEAEVLPQFSSTNFAQNEIGEPILETVLEAGDLLYFPRGFIHQGDCLPEAHSLHITVSSFQRNSWGDLLEKLLPAALHMAIEEDVEYRQGLPIDYMEYTGVLHSDVIDPRRTAFMKKVHALITKLMNYAPVDAAVDQKAKDFFHDCLPPVLTEMEKAHSVYGLPARWENGDVQDVDIPFSENTQVRLLRYGIIRLCSEGDRMLLYYTTENSRVYHKEEPKYCEIEPEYTDGIEFLLSCYPKYVRVEDLPCDTLEDRIALATILFEKGLLVTKSPLFPL